MSRSAGVQAARFLAALIAVPLAVGFLAALTVIYVL